MLHIFHILTALSLDNSDCVIFERIYPSLFAIDFCNVFQEFDFFIVLLYFDINSTSVKWALYRVFDPLLCSVKYIKHYLDKRSQTKSEESSGFLITYSKLLHPVSKDTHLRVKEFMTDSRIDAGVWNSMEHYGTLWNLVVLDLHLIPWPLTLSRMDLSRAGHG